MVKRLNNVSYKIICVKFKEKKNPKIFLKCGRTSECGNSMYMYVFGLWNE